MSKSPVFRDFLHLVWLLKKVSIYAFQNKFEIPYNPQFIAKID